MSEGQEDELDQQPVTVGTRSAPLDWKDGVLAFAASVASFAVFLLLAGIAILAVFFLLGLAALLLPGIDPWGRLLFGAFGSDGGLLLVVILLPVTLLALQLPHYWWKSLAFERDRLIVHRRWFRPVEIAYADGIRIDGLNRRQAVLAYIWPYRHAPLSFVHPSVSVSGYHALRWGENVALFIPDSGQRFARITERVNSRYGSRYTPRKWRHTLRKNSLAFLVIAALTLIVSAPLHFLSEDADGGLAYLDSPAIVRLYLAKEKQRRVDPEGLAIYLQESLKQSRLSTVTALIESGANVARIDQLGSAIGIVVERFFSRVPPPPPGMLDWIRGERPVQITMEEALAFIDLLLAHGARIDGDARSVPLHKATERRNADLARALLKRGAEVNETDRNGRTALFVAAASGNLGLVTLLLDAGADPRWQDDLDVTPMHVAAAPRARVLVIEALLKRGAPADAADYAGETPLIAALGTGAPGARKPAGSPPVDTDRTAAVKALLRAGARADAADARGLTPLHFAADRGYREIASLLLERGAALDAQDRAGRTPLMLAAASGRADVARLLIDGGADVTLADKEGLTVISYARKGKLDELVRDAAGALRDKTPGSQTRPARSANRGAATRPATGKD